MKHTMNRAADGTIELLITIPWKNISELFETVMNEIVQKTEVAGFRKGKAPRKIVEEKTNKSDVYEEVIKRLIPDAYGTTIQEEKIRPIINPKIELKEAEEEKDWVIKAITCERPKLKLGDYKKSVADSKSGKQKKIWVPGKGEEKTEEPKDTKPTLDEILMAVLPTIEGDIPELLLEHEVNRLLSELIDQTKKLGLSVEQYLSTTGRNADTLKAEYKEQADRSIRLEFALEDIADAEGILISDDDIDTVIKTAKTDEEKKSLENQRYYIASVLRRQKTLDFLAGI